jgi:hypothetical protein
MNILTDKNGKRLEKGTVVHYKDGWMEVRAVFAGKRTVNLGPIFHSKTKIKGVSVDEVYSDKDTWYEAWSQSESYQCM